MKFHVTSPQWRLVLALSLGPVASLCASPDFYICAAINKGYVTGSKITTTSGVFKRDDHGEWQHIGYNDFSIRSVAVDPRDSQVLYTAALSGCWRTLDGGAHWRQTNSWDMTEGQQVVVDPSAPDTVYLALTDGVGVSTDRAQTWTRRENGLPERGKYTQTIQVDRTKAGRVLAGCESGIYLTENAGLRWRKVFASTATVDDLVQSPVDPKCWVAVTQSDGALLSLDGGKSWQRMPGVPADRALYNAAFDPSHGDRIAIGSWAHGVLTSEDRGKTWTDRNAGLPEPHQVWRVGVDPMSGRLYASVMGQALYASDDFGRTWRREGLEGSLINSFLIAPSAAK